MQNLKKIIILCALLGCVSPTHEMKHEQTIAKGYTLDPLETVHSHEYSGFINETTVLVNPHLKKHFGNWLISNGNVQVILPGIPILANTLPQSDLVLDIFTRHIGSSWHQEKHLPQLKFSYGNKETLTLFSIQALSEANRVGVNLIFKNQKSTIESQISLNKTLPMLSLSFENKSKHSPKELAITFNKHNFIGKNQTSADDATLFFSKGRDTMLIRAHQGWQLDSDLSRETLRSSLPRQKKKTIHALIGIRGAALTSYFVECWKNKSPMIPCTQVQKKFIKTVKINSQSEEPHRILDGDNKLLGILPSLGISYQIPFYREKGHLIAHNGDSHELIDDLTMGQDQIETAMLVNETQAPLKHGEYSYTYQDKNHGIRFRVIDQKAMPNIHKDWTAFKAQQKSPAVFVFPQFARSHYPNSRIELQCDDTGISSYELLILSQGANISQLDLSTCQSESKKDNYLALYGALQERQKNIIGLSNSIELSETSTSNSNQGSIVIKDLTFSYKLLRKRSRKQRLELGVERQGQNELAVQILDQKGRLLASKKISPKGEGDQGVEKPVIFAPLRDSKWIRIELLTKQNEEYRRLLSTQFITL